MRPPIQYYKLWLVNAHTTSSDYTVDQLDTMTDTEIHDLFNKEDDALKAEFDQWMRQRCPESLMED